MIVKLLIEHHFEFLSLKEAAEARPSLAVTLRYAIVEKGKTNYTVFYSS